jgi:hypothetical protein
MDKLKFGKGNAKLDKIVHTFSLPSGYTCPFAENCLSKADRENGKITDGLHTLYRCFSASQESLYPAVRKARWHNFSLLRKVSGNGARAMCELIHASLPKNAQIVRIHVGGDFFSQAYFLAWEMVAQKNKGILFYAYTKSLLFWTRHRNYWTKEHCIYVPRYLSNPYVDNFRLTASFGGRDDTLIYDHNLRSARVVYSEAEAQLRNLEIDHDDSHAMGTGGSFALLLHGTQPKGSPAAKALLALKMQGKGGYTRGGAQKLSLEVIR